MIYAIQSGEGGPIKFGVASDPKARLRELQVGNPTKLTLLSAVHVHAEKERLIHIHLRECAIRGEWFWPTEKAMGVVRAMKQQEIDGGTSHTLSNYIVDVDPDAVESWRREREVEFAGCGYDRETYMRRGAKHSARGEAEIRCVHNVERVSGGAA